MGWAIVNNFNAGMTANGREPDTRYCRLCKHFDIYTNKNILTPFRSSESGDASASTNKIVNFDYSGTTLYGAGVVSGTTDKRKIFTLTNFTSNTWSALSNGQDGAGGVVLMDDLCIVYNGAVYTANTSGISKALVNGGGFTQLDYAVGQSNITQGFIHPKDNNLYIGRDNIISLNNAGSWTGVALTLPSRWVTTSLTGYGNFLAIGAQSSTSGGPSIVYLWDRDTTIANLPETIDWGTGDLKVLENVEGYLIGVSIEYSTVALDPKIVFRYWTQGMGPAARVFDIIRASQQFTTLTLPKAKRKVNNILYFMMTFVFNGVTHEGVWAIGRNSPNEPFGVSFSHLVNNDSALTSGVLNNFYLLGDYMFISYQDNGSYAMSRTDDLANYVSTSIWESLINHGMRLEDRSAPKRLNAVRVSFAPLPTGTSPAVSLYYRTNAQLNASWNKIAIDASTAGQTYAEGVVDTSGNSLTGGTEFEFRIESTGGAQITELKYNYELENSTV